MPPKKGKGAKKIGLTLKALDGSDVAIEIEPTDTVGTLKEVIRAALKEKAAGEAGEEEPAAEEAGDDEEEDQLSLTFNGLALDDDEKTAEELEIGAGAEIVMLQPEANKGSGRFEFANGSIYEGDWKNIGGAKQRHGLGRFEHNGDTYEGEWLKDAITGRGQYTFASGSSYDGEMKDGRFEGRGTFTWAGTKASYIGEWKSNKMHGQGCFVTGSGDRYQGKFANDRFLNAEGHWIAPPEAVARKLQLPA